MVDVDHEIAQLLAEVPRLANKEGDSYNVTFKVLFDDHKVLLFFLLRFPSNLPLPVFQLANTLESLCGTLKAAKRKGQCSYKPQLLLQGIRLILRIGFHFEILSSLRHE
jgi:hypothetical protein